MEFSRDFSIKIVSALHLRLALLFFSPLFAKGQS